MDKTFEEFIAKAKRLGLCQEYTGKVDKAMSKKAFMDIALDANGMPWLARSIAKGWGLTAEYIRREFAPFNNGKYVRDMDGYTSAMYVSDGKTAYGFLTRGCPNKCKWCCVPRKEGNIRPYMDVDEIAIDGRNKLVLMDNNILACDYGLEQIEKIIKRGYRVDFNQALDARLVTEEIAAMLAKVHWLCPIRFGCDTPRQIGECERVMKMIDSHCDTPKSYLMYTMINGNMQESYERLMYFRDNKRVRVVAQPYRDFNNPKQVIPQWQKDMARWADRKELFTMADFKDYEARKGFKCREYFNNR